MSLKIVVMEPYFFPYLGHFDLVNRADMWIAFDTSQYTRHRFGNRNRILHPTTGWQYIIVPLGKHRRETPFNQIWIANHLDWKGLILRQLAHYEKQAPYYKEVMSFVKGCFLDEETSLGNLTTRLFRKTCHYLGIVKPIYQLSEMNLTLGPVNGPGDWGLRIAQALGASEFINPCGGAAILDKNYYQANGVKLTFQSYKCMTYKCGQYQFEPNLSIIDVMMWNSPEEIKHYLDTYHLDSVLGQTGAVGLKLAHGLQQRGTQSVFLETE